MICNTCGKSFHYCSSCSTERCCDNGFCSDKCMYDSDEYKNLFINLNKFLEELSKEQIEELKTILINYSTFEFEMDDVINNYKREEKEN